MRLENYLVEAGQAGFQYERDIYTKLSSDELMPDHFNPAGSGHGPDSMFLYNGIPYNLELKLDMRADFGQVELRNPNGAWEFGGKNEDAKELYRGLNVLQFVEKQWGKHGQPRKETVPTRLFTEEDALYDREHFTDAFMSMPVSSLERHYNTKGTYYIQIGGFGFYYLGKDIAKIGCPRFNPVLRLRIRRKTRTSKKLNGYGFLTALQVQKKPKKSPFNLDKSTDFLKK